MFVMVLENVLQNLSRREKNVQRLSMDSLLNVYKCMLLSSQDFFFFSFLFPSPFLWGLTQGLWQKRKYQMEVYSLLNTIRQYNQ